MQSLKNGFGPFFNDFKIIAIILPQKPSIYMGDKTPVWAEREAKDEGFNTPGGY
jgi:hypothetical protein